MPLSAWLRRLGRKPHLVGRIAHVLGRTPPPGPGRPPLPGDVGDQLALCLQDVREQLARDGMSLRDVNDVTIRTTDFPAARAKADVLGGWLCQAGAGTSVETLLVDHLTAPGAVVEVEVNALQYMWSSGDPVEPAPPDEPVPEHLRGLVRAELDALVRGERPDQDGLLELYGADGATLVEQPEVIWEHPWSKAFRTSDGGWNVVPLWTMTDSPSIIRAEVDIDPDGDLTLYTLSW